MRDLSFLQSPPVYIDIGPTVWRMAKADGVVELPVERDGEGKLTAAGRQKLTAELTRLADRKQWQLKTRAICAVNGAGVLLRKVTIPSMAQAEFQQVLRLQIEKEFPLSPENLAWSWLELSSPGAKREILLAAVRRGVVEEYATLLAAAGFQPEFTLAAWVRHFLCPPTSSPYAILEVGAGQSELISFENGAAYGLRVFPAAGLTVEVVLKSTTAKIIYVSGPAELRSALTPQLSAQVECRSLEIPKSSGETAALAGLRKAVSEDKPLLRLQVQPKLTKAAWNVSLTQYREQLTRAAILLAIVLLFPYAESLLFKPLVAHSLANFKKQKMNFDSVVAPELSFFLYLKQNQPPYLDTLYVLAKASPQGMHINSISLDQQGEVSLKLELQNAQQMMDFRTKLIDTGYFSSITVEEQTPVMNQPKLNARMSLHWKPLGQRPAIKMDSAPMAADAAKPVGGPNKM